MLHAIALGDNPRGKGIRCHFPSAGKFTCHYTILIKNHADANKAIIRVDAGHGLFFGPGQQVLLGDTSLHLAALNGETNVVSLLLVILG
jgi:ankyrin repeat protein